VDPRVGGHGVEWRVHSVLGLSGAAAQAAEKRKPLVKDVTFRHCRQISTNWKYARTYRPRLREGMTFDETFARTLARVFPERSFDRC